MYKAPYCSSVARSGFDNCEGWIGSNSPLDRSASDKLRADAYLIKPSSFGDYAAITSLLARYLKP